MEYFLVECDREHAGNRFTRHQHTIMKDSLACDARAEVPPVPIGAVPLLHKSPCRVLERSHTIVDIIRLIVQPVLI